MAVLHAAAVTVLAKIAVYQPADVATIRVVTLALLVGAAALWSAVDAWLRVDDRGRAWFIGALVAGVVSGVLSVIGRAIFVDQSGISELWPAVTGGAAFTALLVMIPAGLGLLVGSRLQQPKNRGMANDDLPDHRPSGSPAG
ncbi:hypothetical protein [Amycolatopsis nigrescens]|uniref:hypothetical protein n=1 Tax=Amycolatopsis nigrescens TaxID=381445 RepID=UPI000381CBDC